MTEQEALFNYCLRIGDTSLIAGHRLSEWCGHGPILEEDIAMTNIALDWVGQSRTMLQYAGEIEGKTRTEDDFAYQRNERQFYNALISELPNKDFAYTTAKNFFLSAFNFYFYQELKKSKDETLAAFAEKSLKEVTYHLRHTSDWIIRLGDGTDESHQRLQDAVNAIWQFTGDLFEMNDVDKLLIDKGIAVDLAMVKKHWENKVKEVFAEATLQLPQTIWMQSGSKKGVHTEYFGFLLSEMQYLPRTYPEAKW